MTRKLITLVILVILVLFISGCWNRRELNELAISVGEGIDIDDEGKYQISTQIVIPGEIASKTSGAASGLPVRIFTTTEDTVFEAMRELTTKSPRPIYHSHLRVLVIGESLAKEGIGEVLDMFSRDHEYRSDFYIVIAKNTSAENILSILTSIEKIPANNMVSSLETSEKTWAPTAAITLDKLIQDLVTEGKNPVLTGIEVIGEPAAGQTKKNLETIKPTAYLKYSGLAVFKSDKMLGWLDQDESKGYNFIMNNVKNTVTNVNCPKEGKFNYEIVKSKTEVTGKVENNTPKIEIQIKSEGNVGEVKCDIDLTKQKTIEELEKSVEKDLMNLVEMTINNVQEDFSTDVFGFGDAIHRANAEEWENLKSNWNDKHFTDLEINVKADIKIRRLGKIGNSITSEIKE
ncbi:Ger(x)C family spore germination protein [Metabacillus litoralis]|uniref:Ger(x)C family spore germination protein n=1 Tax=Metabacillus litoralis TaxID=152268 RepID=UPI001CFC5CB1|nr:Ger(x)C family spore germination protein [Metabacillus litoralis]